MKRFKIMLREAVLKREFRKSRQIRNSDVDGDEWNKAKNEVDEDVLECNTKNNIDEPGDELNKRNNVDEPEPGDECNDSDNKADDPCVQEAQKRTENKPKRKGRPIRMCDIGKHVYLRPLYPEIVRQEVIQNCKDYVSVGEKYAGLETADRLRSLKEKTSLKPGDDINKLIMDLKKRCEANFKEKNKKKDLDKLRDSIIEGELRLEEVVDWRNLRTQKLRKFLAEYNHRLAQFPELFKFDDEGTSLVPKSKEEVDKMLERHEKEEKFRKKYLPLLDKEKDLFKREGYYHESIILHNPVSIAKEFIKRKYWAEFGEVWTDEFGRKPFPYREPQIFRKYFRPCELTEIVLFKNRCYKNGQNKPIELLPKIDEASDLERFSLLPINQSLTGLEDFKAKYKMNNLDIVQWKFPSKYIVPLHISYELKFDWQLILDEYYNGEAEKNKEESSPREHDEGGRLSSLQMWQETRQRKVRVFRYIKVQKPTKNSEKQEKDSKSEESNKDASEQQGPIKSSSLVSVLDSNGISKNPIREFFSSTITHFQSMCDMVIPYAYGNSVMDKPSTSSRLPREVDDMKTEKQSDKHNASKPAGSCKTELKIRDTKQSKYERFDVVMEVLANPEHSSTDRKTHREGRTANKTNTKVKNAQKPTKANGKPGPNNQPKNFQNGHKMESGKAKTVPNQRDTKRSRIVSSKNEKSITHCAQMRCYSQMNEQLRKSQEENNIQYCGDKLLTERRFGFSRLHDRSQSPSRIPIRIVLPVRKIENIRTSSSLLKATSHTSRPLVWYSSSTCDINLVSPVKPLKMSRNSKIPVKIVPVVDCMNNITTNAKKYPDSRCGSEQKQKFPGKNLKKRQANLKQKSRIPVRLAGYKLLYGKCATDVRHLLLPGSRLPVLTMAQNDYKTDFINSKENRGSGKKGLPKIINRRSNNYFPPINLATGKDKLILQTEKQTQTEMSEDVRQRRSPAGLSLLPPIKSKGETLERSRSVSACSNNSTSIRTKNVLEIDQNCHVSTNSFSIESPIADQDENKTKTSRPSSGVTSQRLSPIKSTTETAHSRQRPLSGYSKLPPINKGLMSTSYYLPPIDNEKSRDKRKRHG